MAAPVMVAKALVPVAAAAVWGVAGGYDGVEIALTAIAASSVVFFLFAMRHRATSRATVAKPVRIGSQLLLRPS